MEVLCFTQIFIAGSQLHSSYTNCSLTTIHEAFARLKLTGEPTNYQTLRIFSLTVIRCATLVLAGPGEWPWRMLCYTG